MPVESGLQLYLNQINQAPLLTAEREKELARLDEIAPGPGGQAPEAYAW